MLTEERIVRMTMRLMSQGFAADEFFVEIARRPVNSSAQPDVFPENALELGVGGGKVEGSERSFAMSLGELLYYVLIHEGSTADEPA